MCIDQLLLDLILSFEAQVVRQSGLDIVKQILNWTKMIRQFRNCTIQVDGVLSVKVLRLDERVVAVASRVFVSETHCIPRRSTVITILFYQHLFWGSGLQILVDVQADEANFRKIDLLAAGELSQVIAKSIRKTLAGLSHIDSLALHVKFVDTGTVFQHGKLLGIKGCWP